MTGDEEILFERRGTAGFITLNRPKALNAVTHNMVRLLAAQLKTWERDASVTRVVISAAGGRAFSAGGDIRALTDLGRAGRFEQMLQFWRDEYALNAMIKRYPKPYVALIDGIVMGGGVGISIHGSHRVAGDKYQFAMPEVGIGFFPDVGATWFLPRLPGELGAYVALTGARLDGADSVVAKVATHRITSARFPELQDALCGAVSVDALLAAFAEPAGTAAISGIRPPIDRLFVGDEVEQVLSALDREAQSGGADAAFAAESAATIRQKSPTSLKLALAQVRAGREMTFDECMRMEFRIVSRVIGGHDFYEGVRAVIVDKDNAPRWQPATLAEVSRAEVDRYFAPVERELDLP
jgi:enoyl-CoA hydratase